LKLIVYEHISGGGFAGKAMPASTLSEGFSMLATLILDFKAAGHSVTTILDSRIARLNPPIAADCVMPVFSPQEARANLLRISEQADATYIIAPETSGVLQSLVELLEQRDVASLNCPASVIEKVSDKAVFYDLMRRWGLSLPETMMIGVADDLDEIRKAFRGKLNFPLIIKPSKGVSCCGLSVAKNVDQLAAAVQRIKRESYCEHFLIQELVIGAAASVSFLSTGDDAVAISLNRQEVTLETPEAPSKYSGGWVPFDNPLKDDAFKVAEKLVKAFPDLRGYLGVDFVMTENEAVVVEVNPRLTTSYLGLRRVFNFNPAQAILNAVLKRELPTRLQRCGYTFFSKIEMPNPTTPALHKIYEVNEIVSPPFPISQNGTSSALIAAHGSTLKEAKARFHEVKKRVLNTISRGI
jgi:predicted ATP-grasp superfamily ATP-dependent carboligase